MSLHKLNKSIQSTLTNILQDFGSCLPYIAYHNKRFVHAQCELFVLFAKWTDSQTVNAHHSADPCDPHVDEK